MIYFLYRESNQFKIVYYTFIFRLHVMGEFIELSGKIDHVVFIIR